MSVLRLVTQESVLRSPAYPIAPSEKARRIARDLTDTLLAVDGLGLAAPQIGLPYRMIAVRRPLSTLVYAVLNPIVVPKGTRLHTAPEGCLSFPGESYFVTRSWEVTVTGTIPTSGRFYIEAKGWFARAWAHEYDHIQGKVLPDHALPSSPTTPERFAEAPRVRR